MKLLLVSDDEDKGLWDYYTPDKTAGVDMILSAGDLKADYLTFLVTVINRPLVYIHGNHDRYDRKPPEGCDCAEDKVVTVNGLRILGLGGSPIVGDAHYCSENDMARRIRKCRRAIKKAGGVDIILTHCPARGLGDEDTPSHRGYDAFLQLIDEYQPRYFIH